jgi:CxxC-x17-CxxC domain-containing protein
MANHNQNDITFFAKTNFRNQERVFGIKTDDRRRHMYVIGKTGMGKTNLLENLAIQDIQKGHGIAFIDPHGDTAEKLIKAIPSNRINDVIYFNPADQDFPIAFNVMEKVDPEYRHLVASGLVGVFKKIWADSWGPRLEYILRNAILALLEYPGSTLLGVTRILVDKSYRDRVVEKVTDPVVRSFWVDEFSKWNDRVLQEVISPIQNKVGQFLTSSLVRNIVGQTVSSFDIRQIMDDRKILIMNLSKGRIGEDNSALLGAMIITKIQLAAMARVDIPEETRNDFYLYVDEFQNFATESFANILSEARKYHLNLILANQYITQIDEKVCDAIFGNAGSIISFRVGAADAEYLEKEFEPVFMMNDIVNLPKYQIYLKLMIDGIAGDAFSATTLPPIKLEDAGNEEKIIRISRERYTAQRTEVEDKIRRWSGMLTPEEKAALLADHTSQGHAPATSAARPASVSLGRPAPARPSAPAPRPAPRSAAPSPSRPASASLGRPMPTPRPSQESVAPKPVAEPVARQEVSRPVLPLEEQPMKSPEAFFTPPLAPKRQPIMELPEEEPAKPVKQGKEEPVVVPEEVPSVVLETPVQVPEEAVMLEEERPVEEVVELAPEKQMYAANCATCGLDIEVPFEPDGKRPTFCKDCLRDYQRATAKARQEMAESKSQPQPPRKESPRQPARAEERTFQPKTYASADAPLSLMQAQHIGPKKFKSLSKRPPVDLDEVRGLINAVRRNDEE